MTTWTFPTPAGAAAPRRRPLRRLGVLLAVLALLLGLAAVPASARTATVDVHFTPSGTECDATVPHERQVELPRVLTGALTELLAGPTAAERASSAGATMFGPATAGMLRSVNIRDGVAHVDFHDLRTAIPNASTACGSASLMSQLNATARQFPTVLRARYSIDGSEETFYHWLQGDVPPQSAVTATRGSLSNHNIVARSEGDAATLRAVRVGRHPGFDRVVFEFAGGVPGYRVDLDPLARAGGSGAPIPTAGTAALQVTMQAASVDLELEGFPKTYEPSMPLTPRYPTVIQVLDGGYYEGVSTFAVGVTARSGFRVLELTGPPRIAIDIAHGASVRDLRRGDRGTDVRDWQDRLNTVQHGFFASSVPAPPGGPLALDGGFGPQTERATRVFQQAEGVRDSGVVDAATRDAMRRALERSARVPA